MQFRGTLGEMLGSGLAFFVWLSCHPAGLEGRGHSQYCSWECVVELNSGDNEEPLPPHHVGGS